MSVERIKDTANYVFSRLLETPLTYLNTAVISVSLTDIEVVIKIMLYLISIITSILVGKKYLLEIKKLKKEAGENHDKNKQSED